MPAPAPRAAFRPAARRPDAEAGRGAAPAGGFPRALFAPASFHEAYAAGSDAAAATAFALAGLGAAASRPRPVLWVRHAAIDGEVGAPYPPGLERFGVTLEGVTLLRLPSVLDTLRAGLEGARHLASGVVLVEIWGEAKALDFTASRRLALAAEGSGATLVVVRLAAPPGPSAAQTRWRVGAAASRALDAGAPGAPCFVATLLRDRSGRPPGSWALEWRRDEARFEPRALDPADILETGDAIQEDHDVEPRPDVLRSPPLLAAGGAPLRGAVVPFPADGTGPAPAGARGAEGARKAGDARRAG